MTTDHLTDGALARRLDGELGAEERTVVERHLGECLACRRALSDLEEISARFSAALPAVDRPATGDGPAGPRRPARPASLSALWRVAAAVALVAGLAIAIAPVRAWIADRLGIATEPGIESPAGEKTPVRDGRATDSLRVAFVPDAGRFVVRVTNPQAGGRLLLVAAPGEEAVAEIGEPEVGAEVLVQPDGIAIRNRPGATADYRVSVPASLASVEVRVGGRVAWSGSGARLRNAPVTVPLSPAR